MGVVGRFSSARNFHARDGPLVKPGERGGQWEEGVILPTESEHLSHRGL